MSVRATRLRRSRSPRCRSACRALLSPPPKSRSNERRSGYADLSRDTKAMQDDDTANPGMLSVLDGEALWKAKAGDREQSCADCHGDARTSMKGVAARYPAFDASIGPAGQPRAAHQPVPAAAPEGAAVRLRKQGAARARRPMSAMQSRGSRSRRQTIRGLRRSATGRRELFNRRQGQLNLSCAQCHDDNWGKRLAGNIIPQAHPNGYPLYRLEWQSLGSLQRRLRNCMIGMRAEPYDYGAPEYVAMELYLMWRARGMKIETPAVRP